MFVYISICSVQSSSAQHKLLLQLEEDGLLELSSSQLHTPAVIILLEEKHYREYSATAQLCTAQCITGRAVPSISCGCAVHCRACSATAQLCTAQCITGRSVPPLSCGCAVHYRARSATAQLWQLIALQGMQCHRSIVHCAVHYRACSAAAQLWLSNILQVTGDLLYRASGLNWDQLQQREGT